MPENIGANAKASAQCMQSAKSAGPNGNTVKHIKPKFETKGEQK
jgi:hypothetical protein